MSHLSEGRSNWLNIGHKYNSQLHTMRSRAGHSLENVDAVRDGEEARRRKALWNWTTQEHRFVDVVTRC